ncbi:O-acetylhomoserine sulfhydrylase [Arboricoccus pini]|uniref:O-acetylhomoserine sulfhydrylase n=1 Tax=Arboricoccus pini TaxID=1963835 RepID=A0A212Q266_9PROT|nr:aminotransferase class V-fold PLP-dependent enzyme [Arboricoccus pini]SNB53457.1 O-acetylhomoserine sulfhydrylase [Arboricoccus pini]
MSDEWGFETRAVHVGGGPDPATGARAVPIYQTTSYVFEDAEHAAALFDLRQFGNIYSRLTNPTVSALEARMAALEGGSGACATASGHAAQFLTFLNLLQPGNHVVAGSKLYGGSISQMRQTFPQFGWEVSFVDQRDLAALEMAIRPSTRALFVESVSNPDGIVADIEAIARIAHAAGVPLIVDNTLPTPYLCQPLRWGADIVVHSLTKYVGGHGNSIGGVIVEGGTFDWDNGKFPLMTEPSEAYHGLRFYETFKGLALTVRNKAIGLRDIGPALSPFNAFLLLQGTETLALRMDRHIANADKVAAWLETRPGVAWVSYGRLPANRTKVAEKYCPRGLGSVFTFGLEGGYEAGVRIVNACKLLSHVANIGDTRSLIIHPASTTHRQLSDAERRAAGAGPDVVRLSIGIERAEDIIADLDQALCALG